MNISCAICGNSFTARRCTARYCGDCCRQRAHRLVMRLPRAHGRQYHGSPACSVANVSPPSVGEKEERNKRRRLRRAKKALEDEANGLRKRKLNMRTRELLCTSNGKVLAKDVLEECMLAVHALAQCFDPLDRDDNVRVRVNPNTGAEEPAGDLERFLACLEAAARYAKWLAPFQSPKLRRVAVAEAPSEIREETSFTCSIFSARGEQVSKIMNGQAAEGSDETAPTTPPGHEPAEAGDIGDMVDTSLQKAKADDPQSPRYQPRVEGIAPPRIKQGR
jgi:hypothetical protein